MIIHLRNPSRLSAPLCAQKSSFITLALSSNTAFVTCKRCKARAKRLKFNA